MCTEKKENQIVKYIPRVTTLKQEYFSYVEYIPLMPVLTENKWVVQKAAIRRAKAMQNII